MERAAEPAAALAVHGLHKHFGAVHALDDISLRFAKGEVHAILGENGAGKSTLMQILAGVYAADAGSIEVDGRPVTLGSPRDAAAHGIGMVHQHFTLVEALTVAENLALSLSHPGAWRLDLGAVAQKARALATEIGLDLPDPDLFVRDLPVGTRQRLEILKALARADRVLILDEPTAVLTPHEVAGLFEMLRRLQARGLTILFITHKLREVRELADRVSIMRRGALVGTYAVGALSEAEMAEHMVGHMDAPVSRPSAVKTGSVVLEIDRLSVADEGGQVGLSEASLVVHRGEILGIAGVDGNGQRELFEALVGLQRPVAGRVVVNGIERQTYSPDAALEEGIGHIPPDRHRQGLVLAMSVRENLLLHRRHLNRLSRYGLFQPAAVEAFANDLIARYAIHCSGPSALASELSGGNQQRVVIARELAGEPSVLVVVNPTRGLDLAASRAVLEALRDIAARGCAIVLVSTDLDEVLDSSDRVVVLYRGRVSEALARPFDVQQLGLLMGGAEGHA